MRIDGGNYQNNQSLPLDLLRLQVGQRVRVEILSQAQNEEGTISLEGRILKAKLEAQVQIGERFLAIVKETNDNGIILGRESLNNSLINNLAREQIIVLMNRGAGLDPEVLKIVTAFKDRIGVNGYSVLESNNPKLQNIITLLMSAIPLWSQVNGQNYQQIINFFYRLGLDYERQLHGNYKRNNLEQNQSDSNVVKLQLLRLLSDESLTPDERESLKLLLDEITGQQLWAQSGTRKNAFFLMHFPLQDQGEIFYCVLAFESARKGRKMDFAHCHIALQVETRNLAKVGVDLRLYENKLHLLIINDNVESISPLIQSAYGDLKQTFADIGIYLELLSLKTFEEYPQFTKFIMGDNISGVDVKG